MAGLDSREWWLLWKKHIESKACPEDMAMVDRDSRGHDWFDKLRDFPTDAVKSAYDNNFKELIEMELNNFIRSVRSENKRKKASEMGCGRCRHGMVSAWYLDKHTNELVLVHTLCGCSFGEDKVKAVSWSFDKLRRWQERYTKIGELSDTISSGIDLQFLESLRPRYRDEVSCTNAMTEKVKDMVAGKMSPSEFATWLSAYRMEHKLGEYPNDELGVACRRLDEWVEMRISKMLMDTNKHEFKNQGLVNEVIRSIEAIRKKFRDKQ